MTTKAVAKKAANKAPGKKAAKKAPAKKLQFTSLLTNHKASRRMQLQDALRPVSHQNFLGGG